jgi:hypothetical protein
MRFSEVKVICIIVLGILEIYAERTSENSSEQAIEKARRGFKANKEAIIIIDELLERVRQVSMDKAVSTTFANFASVSGVLLPFVCPLAAPYAIYGTIAGFSTSFVQGRNNQESTEMHNQVLKKVKEVIEEQPFLVDFFNEEIKYDEIYDEEFLTQLFENLGKKLFGKSGKKLFEDFIKNETGSFKTSIEVGANTITGLISRISNTITDVTAVAASPEATTTALKSARTLAMGAARIAAKNAAIAEGLSPELVLKAGRNAAAVAGRNFLKSTTEATVNALATTATKAAVNGGTALATTGHYLAHLGSVVGIASVGCSAYSVYSVWQMKEYIQMLVIRKKLKSINNIIYCSPVGMMHGEPECKCN